MLEQDVRPPIVISEADKPQLDKLAQAALRRAAPIADELLIELGRAEVRPARTMPDGTVRMHSFVRFQTDKGADYVMQLVYPEDADIIQGRLSILSRIGTALIGLSEGQSMRWIDHDGQVRTLVVTEVSQQPLG